MSTIRVRRSCVAVIIASLMLVLSCKDLIEPTETNQLDEVGIVTLQEAKAGFDSKFSGLASMGSTSARKKLNECVYPCGV